jgi:hypothetical protein
VELTRNYRDVGLPVPSLIRTTKIATIEVVMPIESGV